MPEIPVEQAATLAAPSDLTAAEQEYWRQFAPILAGAKVLTTADVETLADYCRACAAVVDRSSRVRAAFADEKASAQTLKMLDAQLRGWVAAKTKLAAELGLTAVARTRVAWAKPDDDKPQTKLAQLQQQAQQQAHLRRIK